ncbi:helicase HerA domain-containing protein [Actinomycetospora rhizophila]|uniref:Helicase HerA domain-containing protein n=1 Tax=Actinomycetospora rhizophila TaxID=1416876 RepID=A0ABV9ZKS3_9PSEU
MIGATFVEPFITKPQDAIVNSAASVAAYFSANKDSLPQLWNVYLWAVLALMVIAIYPSVVRPPSFLKSACYQLSTRAGRVVLLGGSALILEGVSRISADQVGGVPLIVGTLLLVVSLSVDWTTLWRRSKDQSRELVQIVDARSPSMIVVSNVGDSVETGDAVLLGSGASEIRAAVVALLPGEGRSRAVLVMESESHVLTAKIGSHIDLQATATHPAVVGLVAAGSTPTSVLFDEVEPLAIGDPLVVGFREGDRLYQVSGMRLVDESWSGSKTVTARTSATLLGENENGHLRVAPELPPAHSSVRRPSSLVTSTLPGGYHRIGKVKGTEFPIGITGDAVVSGHIAVVGMSGMGKTTLVSEVCRSLGSSKFVLAVDTTGEYVQRLGMSSWEGGDFGSTGTWVYEPRGEEPKQAKKLVEDAMTVAYNEYASGQLPLSRVICMEEAHTFVPEFNFCARPNLDHVNDTARMVMQARKYALSFLMVTQRTAVLSKSVLSQCESYAVFRTVDDTSLSYLETVGGPIVRDVVPSLGRHEMLCVGPAFNCDSPVIVEVDPPSALS